MNRSVGSAIDGSDRAGRGRALLSQLISHIGEGRAGRARNALGIPGTVGGALRGNAGGRGGDIGQFVDSVTVMSVKGEISTRRRKRPLVRIPRKQHR